MARGLPDAKRLHKVLANAGYGSRREIEKWIVAGRLAVNGRRAELGAKVVRADRIMLDGKPLQLRAKTASARVLALHKPEGVICTLRDPRGRPTAHALLPKKDDIRWVSVGRLDINTSGLLLFTDNGELAHRLMHPRHEIDREYAVRVFGDVSVGTLSKLTRGVEIDGETYAFEDVVKRGGRGANRWYYCVVRQGRNREIRRLWESQGCQVSRLIRSRFGNIMLPRDLKAGAYFEVKGIMLTDLYRLVNFTKSRQH